MKSTSNTSNSADLGTHPQSSRRAIPLKDAGDVKTCALDHGRHAAHELSFSLCENRGSDCYVVEDASWGFVQEALLAAHDERSNKDGWALIGATLFGGRCDRHVVSVTLAIYEIDGKLDWEDVIRELKVHGFEAFAYTTHNHLRARQSVSLRAFQKWHLAVHGKIDDPTDQTVQEYVSQNKRLAHLKNVSLFDGGKVYRESQFGKSVDVFDIRHEPEHKIRIVFPLNRPIVLKEGQISASDWAKSYRAFGQEIFGDKFSLESANAARLNYLPSHKPGMSFDTCHLEGKLIDADAFIAKATANQSKSERVYKSRFHCAGNGTRDLENLRYVLSAIPPDIEYPDWFKSLAAIYHESLGSEQGNALAHEWSSGDQRYDFDQVESIWEAFDPLHPNPCTLGTLVNFAQKFNSEFRMDKSTRQKGSDFHSTKGDGESTSGEPMSTSWEEWIAHVEELAKDDIDYATALLDELADLQANVLQEQQGLKSICGRLGWAPSNCVKDLKKELKAAKKRSAQKKQRPRREDDHSGLHNSARSSRKLFMNWHLKPFSEHMMEVIEHLKWRNGEEARLFVSGTEVVALHANSKSGLKQIVKCETEAMRHELARIADWGKIAPEASDAGETVPLMDFDPKFSHCPRDVANFILSAEAASLGLPELNGLKHAPFFDKDGNLIMEPGYHAASGYYYSPPASGLEIPTVHPKPTKEDVERALDLILFEAYGDFPFNDGEDFPDGWLDAQCPATKLSIGKASRANQLAKTLQPFVEQMIEGFLPLHATDKPTPRTGSQFLAQALGIIAFGAPPPVRPAPKHDDEWQKTILAAVYEGAPYCLFDNVKQTIASDALASAITSDTVIGRDLGRTRQISGKNRGITEVNGNNLEFDRDIAERVLLVRLDARLKDPSSRKTFRHPSLSKWCQKNRGDLVWACLTIIQNWIAKGKPEMTDKGRWLAGFEEYFKLMGGVMEAAGLTDFNGNRHLIRTERKIDEMDTFVGEWLKVFGTEYVKMGICEKDAVQSPARRAWAQTQNLVELLLDISDEITLGLFSNPNRSSLNQRLGHKLQECAGRIFDIENGTYVLEDRSHNGRTLYRLAPLNGSCNRNRLKPGTQREDLHQF